MTDERAASLDSLPDSRAERRDPRGITSISVNAHVGDRVREAARKRGKQVGAFAELLMSVALDQIDREGQSRAS